MVDEKQQQDETPRVFSENSVNQTESETDEKTSLCENVFQSFKNDEIGGYKIQKGFVAVPVFSGIDFLKISSALMNKQLDIKDFVYSDSAGFVSAYLDNDDGSIFYAGNDVVSEYSFSSAFSDKIFKVFRTTSNYYGTSEYLNTESHFTDKEIKDFSKTSAINLVDEVLNDQNIEIPNIVVSKTIDQESLKKTEDWLDRAGELFNQRENKNNYYGKWDDSDECYYLTFSWDVEGIPFLTETIYGTESIETTSEIYRNFIGVHINALVSRNGIEFLEIPAPLCISELDKEECLLISAEQAMSTVKTYYEQMILDLPLTLESMELNYLLVYEADEKRILPAWHFTYSYQIENDGEEVHLKTISNLFVNAVDGSIITY